VVERQGGDSDAALLLVVRVHHRARVSCVGTKYRVPVEENSHASRPTQLRVVLLLQKILVHLVECRVQLSRHSLVHLCQLAVVSVEFIRLDLFLHVVWKHFFYVRAHVVTVQAMPVANWEEMQTKLTEQVRNQDVRVLVLFVRIAGLVANRSRKGKLRNAIKPFIGNFDRWLWPIGLLNPLLIRRCLRTLLFLFLLARCFFWIVHITMLPILSLNQLTLKLHLLLLFSSRGVDCLEFMLVCVYCEYILVTWRKRLSFLIQLTLLIVLLPLLFILMNVDIDSVIFKFWVFIGHLFRRERLLYHAFVWKWSGLSHHLIIEVHLLCPIVFILKPGTILLIFSIMLEIICLHSSWRCYFLTVKALSDLTELRSSLTIQLFVWDLSEVLREWNQIFLRVTWRWQVGSHFWILSVCVGLLWSLCAVTFRIRRSFCKSLS